MYFSYAALSLFTALVAGYAPPRGSTGDAHARDPGLMRRASDGVYFLFSTGDKIKYARSASLEGPWTHVGSVVPEGSVINKPGRNDLWAPDVANINGTYHLYYSVSTLGQRNSAIGLATSDSMAVGTWTDHGSTGVATTDANNYNSIDPNLLDDGGAYYLTFGSFWGGIQQVRLNSAATKAVNAPVTLAYKDGDHSIEGSNLYKHGDFYYLFFSDGKCCKLEESRPPPGGEYKVKVCRSQNPSGGFVDKSGAPCTQNGGTVILESHNDVYAPGGQGVFNDPEFGPVLYYHYLRPSIGYADSQKLFGWNTLDFSSGWPVVA